MNAVNEFLPVAEVFEPESADEICQLVREGVYLATGPFERSVWQ